LFRRRTPPPLRLRPRHHAVHFGVDHPAVAHRRLAVPREALEGRRDGPPQDQPVHALRHDRFVDRSVAWRRGLAEVASLAGRRAPVQYAKRVVGRKVYGGANTYLPLRVNTAGVIPVIFASSILVIPQTIASMIKTPWAAAIGGQMKVGEPLYYLLQFIGIIFFGYFYTSIVFNPVDTADNMRKYGGFIPGIRPGKKTSDYIDRVLTRI